MSQAVAVPQPSDTRRRVRLIAAAVLGAIVVGVVLWLALSAGLEQTDDAQIEAEVVAVPARTGGVVKTVLFHEDERVKVGQLLAELDDAQHQARLGQAEAELSAAREAAAGADAEVAVVEANARGQRSAATAGLRGTEAGLEMSAEEIQQARAAVESAGAARRQSELDLERSRKLFAERALPRQRLDAAQTAFDAAAANLQQAQARLDAALAARAAARSRIGEAQARVGQASPVDSLIAQARARAALAHARVESAQATRDLAALDRSYAKIVAPRDGVASRKMVAPGQMLTVGQPVCMIVPTNDVWVVANFKETQLEKLRPGQHADVSVDAYGGLRLSGTVSSISGGTGARFSLLPPENATGNFTKVVQRVPVRITLDQPPTDRVLRAGMSVEVTVNTRK
jgi:membrane fusion protein (multidrug efflux system)